MAENLNQGINRFDVDVATGSGNTVIGTAVPSDEASQGISKGSEDSGVFIYTDKSFSIYLCYGGTWELYDTIDATSNDISGGVSIPWASHSTHGASTSMYFLTEESDHTVRTMAIETHLITDFIPGDGVFTQDALVLEDTVVTKGSTLTNGAGLYYMKERDMGGKTAGETFSYELNGQVAGALTIMDSTVIIKTTISYSSETGKSTISFVLPANYTNQAIVTHTRGGSPLSDPFTRSVTIPTSNLQIHLKPEGTEGAGVSTHTNYGTGADLADGTAQGTYRSLQVTKWDYVASSFGLVDTHIPSVDWSHNSSNTIPKPYTTEINNGLTVVTPVYLTSNYSALVGDKLFYQLANNDDWTLRSTDTKSMQLYFKDHDGSGNWNLRMNVAQTAPWGTGAAYETSGYPMQAHAWNVILFQWDGDTNNAPILKINGVAIELTQTQATMNGHEANSLAFGGGVPVSVGEVAIYESALSGTDLEQLEAYFDFKYINYADSEVMFQTSNLADIHGRVVNNPPGENDTITGYNNTQIYFDVRTEKMAKVGSRAEFKYTSTGYVYNGPNHVFITDDLEWSSKNKNYGYFYNDMKDTSAGYLLRIASNYLYLYESDGAGTAQLVYSDASTYGASDEISFIVEWDGTCKVAKNGTVLFTASNYLKFTVGSYIAPFLWHQRTGTGAITMDGNLVDWAWPSNYSSEAASDATPVKVEGTGNVTVSGNHINNFANPMGKGGSVKIGTLQGEGAYVDWQPHIFHNNNRQHLTLSTTEDVFDYNDANAEMSIRSHYLSTYNKFHKDGAEDHLHTRSDTLGHTSWADYYNDISNSYDGDTDINLRSFGRTRIQFYDDHVILWQNGYPLYRWTGIDTSQQYYFNWKSMDATWTAGLEDIKIYNP